MATQATQSTQYTESTVADSTRDVPLSRAALVQMARLDRTLQDLRTRIAEQSTALQKVSTLEILHYEYYRFF